MRLADTLDSRGVIIERGDICYLDPVAHSHDFRLGFAAIRLDAIEPGMQIVGQVIREQLEDAGDNRRSTP